ncbi:hypothetical protein [Planktothrix agardhii]|uniref:hypothetical protein n=1 Tax=Planktothrix agardhii TaxID=1160 RepID=UPI001D0B59CB|nr:hypothetical protein [Planktothrix agardhii]MCB8751656.1 hypothetical protein [Planktothrix agardhii 1810]
MANEYLETLYQNVFEQVYPQVKDQKNGVLYKVIYILLEGQESKADEICTDLRIKDNASREDDRDLINFLIFQPRLILSPFGDNWFKNIINPDMVILAWIVIIACLFVGVPVCSQYINKRKQKPTGNTTKLPPSSSPSQELPPITAALCLVIQASVFIDLRNKHPNALEDNRLSCSDVKMLIDYSSHFLCIRREEVPLIEEHLEITREEIPNDSNQEVYIRIHISNGQNIIGKEVPYILKRDLPSDGKRIIQRRVSLKNLSGLENFNHI